jgi:hypothetical protein
MDNVYLHLTAKINEKLFASTTNINVVREEIKFIAGQIGQDQSVDAQIDSAFCYYIAGYYVQALHVAQRMNLRKINPISKWLLLFLRKDIESLKKSLTETISNKEYDDQCIKNQLDTQGLSDIEAVNIIINFKTAEVMMGLVSFIETGDENKILELSKTLKICQNLVSKSGEWAIWWRLECLKMIVKEFVDNSLWTQLRSFSTDPKASAMVEKYIFANYSKRKIIELWRTQVESLPKINDSNRCSFCISVPTSGGKTTVAELAILRFLIDYQSQPETKCVYIAPFRKLALEIEGGLSNAFSLINTDLATTFYGGREIDVFDNRAVEKARILIVTPEKLDSMLRQYPDLLSQIKLVVADEGHMIGDHSLRGYRYRFLLERLIYKLRIRKTSTTEKPRIILISGVLPNIEEFADLISGSRTNIVKVDWRPLDKPSIGSWEWTGKKLRTSDVDLVEPIPFDTKCKSPDGFEEIVAKVALSYAHTQPTMVFSASKRAIESTSLLNFLECVASNHKLFKSKPLPKNLVRASKFRQYYALLEKGIAIHHANLPRDLRKEIEARIDNQQIRLLFTSPTLANGVNIPFQNILVYRLQHYYGVPIHPATFWNVVGRVGRPIRKKPDWSNLEPPLVLFFLNRSWKSNDEDQIDARLSVELRKKRAEYQVASPFLKFLQQILDRWSEASSHSISELISNLAEKDKLNVALGETIYANLQPIDKTSIDDFLKILDEHICALLTENKVDENNASEWLQQSATDLVDILVKASEIDEKYLEDIKLLVRARIKFNLQHLSSSKRYQNFLLGLPVNDCEEIKKNEELLLTWYKECSGMFAQDFDNGLVSFVNILKFIASLSICNKWQIRRRARKNNQLSFALDVPDRKTIAREKLFRNWINGENLETLEISLKQFSTSISIDSFIEGMFENSLPWGFSAICRYLNAVAEQRGISLAKDLEHLSAFVKYGVNSKIACQLVRFGIPRVDAVKISSLSKDMFPAIESEDDEIPNLETDFSETIKLINGLTENDLKAMSISKETIKRIANFRKNYNKENIITKPEIPPFEFDPIYDAE